MDNVIIGRGEEIKILEGLLKSSDPELLAIYGRRRVGKTYLIDTFFKEQIVFRCSGVLNGKKNAQLHNFAEQLGIHFPKRMPILVPTTWQDAFWYLREAIDTLKGNQKKVIFFDELPWFDSQKSGFLSAFGYFWNMHLSMRRDIIVVICGSAASWIINKVVNDKGGLHNRITQRIRLLPFNLHDTEAYLRHRKITLDRYQILQLYMVMGGVPAYLNSVTRGQSALKAIQNSCFTKDGTLANEFGNLYSSLFKNPERHVSIITALAKKGKGLTRTELLKSSKMLTGGTISTILDELTESGFIEKTYPIEKKSNDSLYRLIDEFSLFYLKFMHSNEEMEIDKERWFEIQGSQSFVNWCGYAFENLCIKHVGQIKKALQIGGVHTKRSAWYKAGGKNTAGAQIDLLLDRADNCINICEVKFTVDEIAIDKKYAEELRKKVAAFQTATKTRKVLFLTFITTYGVAENDYRGQLVDSQVTMDALFE